MKYFVKIDFFSLTEFFAELENISPRYLSIELNLSFKDFKNLVSHSGIDLHSFEFLSTLISERQKSRVKNFYNNSHEAYYIIRKCQVRYGEN